MCFNLGWDLPREWLHLCMLLVPCSPFNLGILLAQWQIHTKTGLFVTILVFDRIMCSNSVIIHGRAWFVVLPSEGAVFTLQKQKCCENGWCSRMCAVATSSSCKIGSVEISCWRIACQRCLFQSFLFDYFLLLDTYSFCNSHEICSIMNFTRVLIFLSSIRITNPLLLVPGEKSQCS